MDSPFKNDIKNVKYDNTKVIIAINIFFCGTLYGKKKYMRKKLNKFRTD